MNNLFKNLSKYNKFIVALLGAILSVLSQQYGDNQLLQAILPLATALGVFQTPNK